MSEPREKNFYVGQWSVYRVAIVKVSDSPVVGTNGITRVLQPWDGGFKDYADAKERLDQRTTEQPNETFVLAYTTVAVRTTAKLTTEEL